jgi:hypothetical protein
MFGSLLKDDEKENVEDEGEVSFSKNELQQ